LKFFPENKNIGYLKSLISVLPENPGIYQYFDSTGKIIYVGKAKNLRKRVASYFTKNHDQRKTALLVRNIVDIRHMVVDTEEDALLLENNLIKKYQPRYNIRLKDDKTYPWICVKNERFPRVFKTRNVIRDGSKYFGPYTSYVTANTLIDLFRSIYKLRNCNFNLSNKNVNQGKYKLCLEYYIGNCWGPCENLVTEELYNKSISEIADILKGNVTGVILHLKQLMKDYSFRFKFEEAQIIKEKLISLEKYRSRSTIVSATITDVDVFSIDEDEKFAFVNYLKVIKGAIIQTHTIELKKNIEEEKEDLLLIAIIEIRQKIYSNAKEILVPFKINTKLKDIIFRVPLKGDKKKLLDLSSRNAIYYRLEKEKQFVLANPKQKADRILERIKKDLLMKELPMRIECFDNSNLHGTNPVASCVVFLNTIPAKKEYRHFNIKTVEGPNDFASMEEVIFRRYKRVIEEKESLPQLIVIDGGKGQLKFAVSALEKLELRGKITIVGIAKRLEEIYFPDDNIPLYIDKNSETLKIIQQLRNEAHRFGINFHRQKRSKNFIGSELENIKGIGPQTIQNLLIKYKSVYTIKKLTLEEISKETGRYKAGLIFNYFLGKDNINIGSTKNEELID
jgi:excinuclease ABC subunit C